MLQVHLYYDHVITRSLLEALVDPEAIQLSRISFAQKLQFIKAMGLVPNELIKTVEFINRMRNKIAHDLSFQISEKDERDLINCTPAHIKKGIRRMSGDDGSNIVNFLNILRMILYQMEFIRINHVSDRILSRKIMLHARVVLEKIPNVVYVE